MWVRTLVTRTTIIAIAGAALSLPNLSILGLVDACEAAGGEPCLISDRQASQGAWGYAKELSSGKDTPSGHWEMAGVPVLFDWGYFPKTQPSFPQEFKHGSPPAASHASTNPSFDRLGSDNAAPVSS